MRRQIGLLALFVALFCLHHLGPFGHERAGFTLINEAAASSMVEQTFRAGWIDTVEQILNDILKELEGEEGSGDGDDAPPPDTSSWFYETRAYVVALHDEYLINTDPQHSGQGDPGWTEDQWSSDVYAFVDEVYATILGEEIVEPDADEQADADIILNELNAIMFIVSENT